MIFFYINGTVICHSAYWTAGDIIPLTSTLKCTQSLIIRHSPVKLTTMIMVQTLYVCIVNADCSCKMTIQNFKK